MLRLRPTAASRPVAGNGAAPARSRLFWIVLTALVVGQLAAFWMLCSQQTRKARMRDMTIEVQRVAVADCLRYIPRATLSSCASRVDPGRRDTGAVVPVVAAAPAGAPDAVRAAAPAPISIAFH